MVILRKSLSGVCTHVHLRLKYWLHRKNWQKSMENEWLKSFFLAHSKDQVHGEIADILDRSRAAWVIYLTADAGGHIMGLLKEGQDKFLLWDTTNSPRVNEVTSESLAELLVARHGKPDLFAYILGFSK